jgi:hypothetical protein
MASTDYHGSSSVHTMPNHQRTVDPKHDPFYAAILGSR